MEDISTTTQKNESDSAFAAPIVIEASDLSGLREAIRQLEAEMVLIFDLPLHYTTSSPTTKKVIPLRQTERVPTCENTNANL